MCALVVEPVHVDDDLGGSPRVQRVNEHLLDLTVAGFHLRVPPTADFHQDVHANKGVGPFVVMFGGCGAELVTATLNSLVDLKSVQKLVR